MYSFSSSTASKVVVASSCTTPRLFLFSIPRYTNVTRYDARSQTRRKLSTNTTTRATAAVSSFPATSSRRQASEQASNRSGGNNHRDVRGQTVGGETSRAKTWSELGLRNNLVQGLMHAYPEVVTPTPAQAMFIPAILEGRDVLLKDDTGSGKSFGIALALLGKPRKKFMVSGSPGQERDSVTGLVLVPQANLAHQWYGWICRIAEGSITREGGEFEMDRIVQRLVRDGQQHLFAGYRKLHETKPHILISTPQAILDLHKKDPYCLPLQYLSTVVVDEVDYLIETAPKKDPERCWGRSHEKAMRKIQKHPGHTRELLDLIYAARKEVNGRTQEWVREEGGGPYRNGSPVGSGGMPGPQLIVSSATLRTHLSNYLYEESGWLNKGFVTKVKKTGCRPMREAAEAAEERVREGARSGRVKHCVIEVSDGEVRNVEGAVAAEDEESGGKELEAQGDERQPLDGVADIQDEFIKRYENTRSPFNPNALEAIATAVALDVPRLALLVIPSSMPVFRAVYELRGMGLDARVFDPEKRGMKRGADESPVVLVTTVAMARGLDLPEASHVFSLGIPEGPRVTGRTVDAYVHVAGRVGRFGRRGTVVTVVMAGSSGTGTGPSEGERMKRVLRMIGVAPVRFKQFA